MSRALNASARGCLARCCLAGALLILSSPALRAGTATQQNPTAAFATPGVKQVTLQVCNSAGNCTSVTKNVTVLDPTPVVTTTAVTPWSAEVGQLILLSGAGTGKPPLSYTWLLSGGGDPFLGLPGATTWWNTAGMPPGGYLASLKVQNSAGSTTSTAIFVALAPATPVDFYTLTPCRIYDTRLIPQPLQSAVARIVAGTGACGVPTNARALAANVSVVSPTAAGYVTFYPGNYPQPPTTMLSFSAGSLLSNHMILPLATTGDGTLAALASMAGTGGTAQLVIDVTGYYAP